MKLSDVTITQFLTVIGSAMVWLGALIGWIWWINHNVVWADDLQSLQETQQQLQYQQAIKDERQWIMILETRLDDETDPVDRQRIERQIDMNMQTIEAYQEKLK